MSKNTKPYDTSTICDQLFQKWLDHYPPEKTTALQDKYLALDKPIRDYTEKLTALQGARKTLESCINSLNPFAENLNTAISKMDSYSKEMDIVQKGLPVTFEDLATSLVDINNHLVAYVVNFRNSYCSNLSQIDADISCLKSLRDFYQTLFNVIVTIRDSYFKTPPDRRKPVTRDLYRLFQSLANNKLYGNVSPDHYQNTSFAAPLDRTEYDSLRKTRLEAANALQTIKNYR